MELDPKLGRKFDSGKPEMSLLPPYALEAVARVLTIGAKKYARDNWKYVADGEYRYKNAAMRHFNEYIKGNLEDPETGENHLAHAICCLMFMLDADESGEELAPADKQAPKQEDVKIKLPPNTTLHAQSSELSWEGLAAWTHKGIPLRSPTEEIKLAGTARPTSFYTTSIK